MRAEERRVLGELDNDAVLGGGVDQEEGAAVLDEERRGSEGEEVFGELGVGERAAPGAADAAALDENGDGELGEDLDCDVVGQLEDQRRLWVLSLLLL